MSGDITATLDREENLPAILTYIMNVRYARALSIKDLQTRQNMVDSYNFKARVMNELYGLSLKYIATSSN